MDITWLNVIAGRSLLALVAATAIAGRVHAEEHPYARAKLGEWAWYTTTVTAHDVKLPAVVPPDAPSDAAGKPETAARAKEREPKEARLQVVEKTDTTVVISSVNREEGRDYESRWTVDLTAPFRPFPVRSGLARELARGAETITVNGARYDTTWVEYEIEHAGSGGRTSEKKKIWRSPRVPIDGMVRSERVYSSDVVTSVSVTELMRFGQDPQSSGRNSTADR